MATENKSLQFRGLLVIEIVNSRSINL